MTRFWISWWQPGSDPRPLHYPPKDRRVLGWWRSGCDEKRTSICALVQADVSDTALAAVATDWPESLTAEVRFVEPQRPDWTPGDRFPLSAWMQERIATDSVATDQPNQDHVCQRLQARCDDIGYDHRCRHCPTIIYIEKGMSHEAATTQAPEVAGLGGATVGGLSVVPKTHPQAGASQVDAPNGVPESKTTDGKEARDGQRN